MPVPLGFVIQHWRGASRALRALRVGPLHGVYYVGCCWGLMVLMFVVGGAHLGWMLVLAAVIFVEKAVTWGRRVTMSVGLILASWGSGSSSGSPGCRGLSEPRRGRQAVTIFVGKGRHFVTHQGGSLRGGLVQPYLRAAEEPVLTPFRRLLRGHETCLDLGGPRRIGDTQVLSGRGRGTETAQLAVA